METIARLRWLLAEDERLRAAWRATTGRSARSAERASDESVDAERTLRREAARALPALLDRLEAAEAVVEAARAYRWNDDDPGALAHALAADLRRYDEVRRG